MESKEELDMAGAEPICKNEETVLRNKKSSDCSTDLGWKPEGKRNRGRPKTTWSDPVEKKRDRAHGQGQDRQQTIANNEGRI